MPTRGIVIHIPPAPHPVTPTTPSMIRARVYESIHSFLGGGPFYVISPNSGQRLWLYEVCIIPVHASTLSDPFTSYHDQQRMRTMRATHLRCWQTLLRTPPFLVGMCVARGSLIGRRTCTRGYPRCCARVRSSAGNYAVTHDKQRFCAVYWCFKGPSRHTCATRCCIK